MPRRYHSIGYCADDVEQSSQSLTINVITDELEPRWTGLYNTDGLKIMAVDTRDPIGFVWFK